MTQAMMVQSGNVGATVLRWTARLGSIASVGMLAMFLFGEGGGVPRPSEVPLMVCFPFGVAAGMMLGWWKELHGGLLTLASLVGLYLLAYAIRGQVLTGPYFALFSLPGLLFLASAVVRGGKMAGRA